MKKKETLFSFFFSGSSPNPSPNPGGSVSSAVRRADMIYVLEGGRIVESGDWDGLTVQESDRFRTLLNAQGIDAKVD